jgi:hypothetical protein
VRNLTSPKLQGLGVDLCATLDKYLNTKPMTYIRERRKEKNKVKPNFIITPNFIAKDTD